MSVLQKEIHGVELSFEGLLKLLGGSADERERFWEIFKGITSRAEARLVESSLVAVEKQLQSIQANLASMHGAAEEIGSN